MTTTSTPAEMIASLEADLRVPGIGPAARRGIALRISNLKNEIATGSVGSKYEGGRGH